MASKINVGLVDQGDNSLEDMRSQGKDLGIAMNY